MDILQKFTDIGLYNIVNKIYMYIQSDIIIHTDIKKQINKWVKTEYNGNYSIKDCTEKEYDEIYHTRSRLRNFKNFYFDAYNEYYNIDLNPYSDTDTHIFYKYYANESERKLCGCYLQKYYANESEQFLCRCNNKEEEYIYNGQYIEIDDSDSD